MLRLALNQVRTHWARYTAIALAVALAAGFVSATLLVNAAMRDTLAGSVGADYAGSDLVVLAEEGWPPTEVFTGSAEAASGVDGVAEASPTLEAWAQGASGRATDVGIMLTPVDPESVFDSAEVLDGALPRDADEIALGVDTAERFDLALGDTLTVYVPVTEEQYAAAAEAGGAPDRTTLDLELVGTIATSGDPATAGIDSGWIDRDLFSDTFGPNASADSVRIALDEGADAASLQAELATVIADLEVPDAADDTVHTGEDLIVLDHDAAVERKVAQLSGGNAVLTWLLMGFALVSVVVAALVVANTFAVVIAQRRRELALLRCIGASGPQVFRSVLVEGLVIGLLGGALGVLGAWGLLAGLVAAAGSLLDLGVAIGAVTPTPAAVLSGLAAGLVLTLIASLGPARSATRVAPLEALRPTEEVTLASRGGRVRGIAGLVVLGLGVALLVAALLLVASSPVMILVGMLGGCLVFVGIVMAAVLVVPGLVGGLGRLTLRPTGIAGHLASLNAVRNRRRTAATATALVVGVGLVTTILMGGQTVKATSATALAERYPVDLLVQAPAGSGNEDGLDLDAATLAEVEAVDGVRAAGTALRTEATPVTENAMTTTVLGISPDDAEALLLPQAPAVPTDGTVAIPADLVSASEVRLGPGNTVGTGDTASSGGTEGTDAPSVGVTHEGNSSDVLLTTPEVLQDTVPHAVTEVLVLRLDPGVGAGELSDLRFAVAEVLDLAPSQVVGSAMERAAYAQVIDILLLVAVGLLAIAVVIALIGVSNTMSLSVIERTRENALLRALGLENRQLRAMLAAEAVLISLVAALIGMAVGSVLGAIGARLVTTGLTEHLVPGVPWWGYGAILAVAIVSGLLSSVLPARRATRLSPVEGLATVE
ncbi:ABC transporter permease [Brevibacterium litoralis]|uniref:ABC transporter permease n=1 Tax=Brevibacterium litoralis TaxID=3138935 RepID=UPI0032EA9588